MFAATSLEIDELVVKHSARYRHWQPSVHFVLHPRSVPEIDSLEQGVLLEWVEHF